MNDERQTIQGRSPGGPYEGRDSRPQACHVVRWAWSRHRCAATLLDICIPCLSSKWQCTMETESTGRQTSDDQATPSHVHSGL